MKKYKYLMKKTDFNLNSITKNVLILLIALLLFLFFSNRISDYIKIDRITGILGQKISASEMPVYSYINDLSGNPSPSLFDRFISYLYPVNQYIARETSQTPADNLSWLDIMDHDTNEISHTQDGSETAANTPPVKDEASKPTEAPKAASNPTQSPPQAGEKKNVSQKVAEAVSANVMTGNVYPKASLENFDFLISKFYTVTDITSLTSDMLKPKAALDKSMALSQDASLPQILIFHTHSQETFVDSVPGDPSTSIVGVGEYLSQLLREKYGLNVIHDTSVYDFVNGVLDRSKAYTYSEEGIKKILEANPSIEVVIDLHRDGVADTTHLVTDINGKKTAKLMFFNGVSYSKKNGNILYLNNPYREDNLAMSLQMQLMGDAYYPGLLRRIYINAYRYCLHLRGKSMLVEAGAQTNTVEEEMNAMEPLADILSKLLSGQKAY